LRKLSLVPLPLLILLTCAEPVFAQGSGLEGFRPPMIAVMSLLASFLIVNVSALLHAHMRGFPTRVDWLTLVRAVVFMVLVFSIVSVSRNVEQGLGVESLYQQSINVVQGNIDTIQGSLTKGGQEAAALLAAGTAFKGGGRIADARVRDAVEKTWREYGIRIN